MIALSALALIGAAHPVRAVSASASPSVKLVLSMASKASDRNAADVHIMIDNRSDTSLRYKTSRPERLFQFQVLDGRKNPAALIKYGVSLLPSVNHDPFSAGVSGWSGPTLELAPGASMGDDLDISKVYQMTANGIYTVQASWVIPVNDEFIDQTRPLPPAKPTRNVTVHSNTIVLRRTPQGVTNALMRSFWECALSWNGPTQRVQGFHTGLPLLLQKNVDQVRKNSAISR